MRALEQYGQNMALAAQKSKRVRLLQTSVALAHAAVDLGVAVLEAGQHVTQSDLFPGLCRAPDKADYPTCGTGQFDKGHAVLVGLSRQLATVEAALNRDWSQVVPNTIATVREALAISCAETDKCQRVSHSLARYAGLFTALASDSDPDHAARAIDAAAMPIGGWQRKLIDNTTAVSVAAFPGIATGGEMRWGTYDNTEEAGDWHWAAPTLTLPIGIDFVFNKTAVDNTSHSLRVFVSILDPAAYLQYDAEKDGRLPGAQIITALAPGLALRFVPLDSPVSINLFGVYRPGLRADESSVTGSGASALQAGVSLSIDVTLFDLYASDPGISD
jgi:hypothetical protein